MYSSKRIFKSRIFISAATILAAAIILIVFGLLKKTHKSTLQGQLENTDYRVCSKVPSRVVRFLVHEGQSVHRGDTLVILSAPEVNAMEKQATASRDASEAVADLTQEGTRKEAISSAYDVWQQAKAHTTIAQKTFQRMNNLYQQGVISAQRRDEIKAEYESAIDAENAAKSQYDMAENGFRSEEKRVSAADVDRSQAKIEQVKAMLNETVITAVTDGYVAEMFVEVGEFVNTGAPIMNISTYNYWFTFNITEDKLPGIDVGRHIRIYIPALNETIPARVKLVKNEGNFAAWKATRALQDIDLKVFEVQAEPLKPLRHPHEGMSAIVVK
jgi:HlyD family secretion protein